MFHRTRSQQQQQQQQHVMMILLRRRRTSLYSTTTTTTSVSKHDSITNKYISSRSYSSSSSNNDDRMNNNVASHHHHNQYLHHNNNQSSIHLIFGANTDVGKTIISTGLVRASIMRYMKNNMNNNTNTNNNTAITNTNTITNNNTNTNSIVQYIKPLQCGGSDQRFVEKYIQDLMMISNTTNTTSTSTTSTSNSNTQFVGQTLYTWDTPISPHYACMIENKPVKDEHVIQKLLQTIQQQQQNNGTTHTTTYIETAGGVLSPSSSSYDNNYKVHSKPNQIISTVTKIMNESNDNIKQQVQWGWTLQGDLYQSIIPIAPVILVGDGRLGGISCTISAIESILLRGYDIVAIIMLEESTSSSSNNNNNNNNNNTYPSYTNIQAIRDYIKSRQIRNGTGDTILLHPQHSIVSLPCIPSNPNIPLYDWYQSDIVTSIFTQLEYYISQSYQDMIYDLRSTTMIHPYFDNTNTNNTTTNNNTNNTINNNNNRNHHPVWIPGSTDPFCQHMFVTSATNNTINIIQPSSNNKNNTTKDNEVQMVSKSITDASASWWTQGIGHGDSTMTLTIAAAVGRYGYISGTPPASCMIHQPVLSLSQTLVQQNTPWAKYVMYTDDGGTSAMEIAIKMGIKTFQERMKLSIDDSAKISWIVGAQEGCYHGDTLGVMNVMESYVSTEHPWYVERSYCVPTPTIGYQNGILRITLPDGMSYSDDIIYEFNTIQDIMDIHVRSISPKLLSLYKEMIEMQWLAHEHRTQTKIATIIIEPLLQCAGGMKFIDPLFQAAMIDVASSRNIPIILDETSTGLYRLGIRSCSQLLLRNPDIVLYSKLLTGGIVSLTAIVTNQNIYDSCKDVDYIYGNTYIANPLACTSALHALSLYDTQYHQLVHHSNKSSNIDNKSRSVKYSKSQPYLLFDEVMVKQISELSHVKECFTLGSVLTVTLLNNEDDDDNGSSSTNIASQIVQEMLQNHHILIGLNQINCIGDVIYIMVPPFTSKTDCQYITNTLYKVLNTKQK